MCGYILYDNVRTSTYIVWLCDCSYSSIRPPWHGNWTNSNSEGVNPTKVCDIRAACYRIHGRPSNAYANAYYRTSQCECKWCSLPLDSYVGQKWHSDYGHKCASSLQWDRSLPAAQMATTQLAMTEQQRGSRRPATFKPNPNNPPELRGGGSIRITVLIRTLFPIMLFSLALPLPTVSLPLCCCLSLSLSVPFSLTYARVLICYQYTNTNACLRWVSGDCARRRECFWQDVLR